MLEIAATAGEPTREFCESTRQERFARIEIAKNAVASVSPPLKTGFEEMDGNLIEANESDD